ncbi:MAG: hypothetical protein C0596_13595 [Marinilabiliales bacterium]|nr:MAG: hypothetical protein C0596_13595 [Marinilabiliales bacterium]
MKTFQIIIVLILVISVVSCGDSKPDKLPSSNQRKTNNDVEDTISDDDVDEEIIEELPINLDSVTVILLEGEPGDQNVVFVDNTNNTEYFNEICNFDMPTKFEISMYRNTFDAIKTEVDSLNKDLLDEIPVYWVPLVNYEGDYYYYHPAKPEYNNRIMITDSSLAVYHQYGVSAEFIKKIKKAHENHFVIEVVAQDENEKKINKEINIYIIDQENNIAIWEEFYPGGIEYRLMIAVTDMPLFPVIVNYGQKSTPDEYKFDEINYFEEIANLIGI